MRSINLSHLPEGNVLADFHVYCLWLLPFTRLTICDAMGWTEGEYYRRMLRPLNETETRESSRIILSQIEILRTPFKRYLSKPSIENPVNPLKEIYSQVIQLPIRIRTSICEAQHWTIEDFMKRQQADGPVSSKDITAILNITDAEVGALKDIIQKYR